MAKRWIVTVITVLAGVVLAEGKGTPDRIVVSGGPLSHAVEITDRAVLQSFDPWRGQFANWKAPARAEVPCSRQSVEVSFFLHASQQRTIYTTRYCSGWVYLPGPGDAHYRENIGTIYRRGQDGQWYPATPAWDALMRGALARADQNGAPDMVLITGGNLRRPVAITDRARLTRLDPWAGSFADWTHAVEPDDRCGREYEVLFFKRGIEHSTRYDRGNLRMTYGLRYCVDKRGGAGFVHIAGANDQYGPENAMVWDSPHGGEWHRATPAWSSFMASAIVK